MAGHRDSKSTDTTIFPQSRIYKQGRCFRDTPRPGHSFGQGRHRRCAQGRSDQVRLFQAIRGATLSSRGGICVDCISFYCRWQLLSALLALTPGPEAAVDMAAVVVSMAAGAEA